MLAISSEREARAERKAEHPAPHFWMPPSALRSKGVVIDTEVRLGPWASSDNDDKIVAYATMRTSDHSSRAPQGTTVFVRAGLIHVLGVLHGVFHGKKNWLWRRGRWQVWVVGGNGG